MIKNLINMAEEFPDLIVQVRLGDLLEANRQLIADAKLAMEQGIADSQVSKAEETYVSRKKAMAILGISSTTIWHWKQINYLVPITVGARYKYRMSDIRRIMEGDDAQEGCSCEDNS